MTSVNRQHMHSSGHPKPGWGPGKNAALSLVAFAVIFGIFAYVKRDVVDEVSRASHQASGVVGISVRSTERPAVASTPPTGMTSPVTIEIEPEAAPRVDAQATAPPPVPAPAPPVVAATNAHAAHAAPSGGAVNARHAGMHRQQHQHPRPHDVANTRTRVIVTARPHSFGEDGHAHTAGVTHEELESARALTKARSCAVLEQWGCVEQNASRVLAIDPQNGESRALLGEAIRNHP
ncbi:hypothetical protein BGV62_18520 [Burkholderia ubonensis]|uniref:hypothetical protein n=1 Tax=Burkholderia ubonensis TaxID=101571 RepID=UPI0007C6B0F1|nr:hypothetical protein [Burkholderia ubonensis]ODQ32468.1 hypothetical protein BGV63_22960 [Burkholderia ubonensis]OJA33548.1 hypothetical protein BGV58_00995 [Burkholderia ubonensis]OJB63336.1 hypothetical protein BGV62_18520 [Burkholderia ubonensis]